MRKETCLTGIVLAVVLGSLALADEGRIPIYQQTIITQPGHYVVTRDFTGSSGAITIQANQVNLDLNGHTVTSGGAGSAILIDSANANTGLVIRNGVLKGGIFVIASIGAQVIQVRIEDVEVDGEGSSHIGIAIYRPGVIEVIHCHIHDTVESGIGILVQTPSSGNIKGRLIDNTIERVGSAGMHLGDLHASEIRGNLISDFGSNPVINPSAGISLGAGGSDAGGNIVQGNVVSSYPGGTDDSGIVIGDSPNNLVIDNVVRKNGAYGILSQANGTRLEGNVSAANGFDGIVVSGLRNYLVGNQSQDNLGPSACGIRFLNGPSHGYRDNNVRGNTLPGFCGPANTDAGGNIQ